MLNCDEGAYKEFAPRRKTTMDKKVIVANYRYHITGGPEVYMFKFLDKCGSIGYKGIPFSVRYSVNEPTEYTKYFISSRSGDSVYYDSIKKTPSAIIKTLQGAFYNPETVRNINKLIDDENPEVLYALQVINTLSPSIFKAAKKRGLKVVHRISDFNLVCPRSDLLRGTDTCNECVCGDLKKCIEHRCYHGSKAASMIRAYSMMYHRWKKLYKYVDYFVTPTDFTRNKLIEGGFPVEKVVTIPTFIDADAITPNYENYDYLLFLGRTVKEKGLIYAVEAMKHLAEYPDLKLKITGNYEDQDPEVKEFIEANNLAGRIEFTGFVRGEALTKLISNAMCVLCPAIWYENMPNTVIEAFAYGKPVIASNFGCFPELITDGTDGYLFEPKNPQDLASKIKLLLADESYRELGKNARRKVEEVFNPEQHFEKLKKIFEL